MTTVSPLPCNHESTLPLPTSWPPQSLLSGRRAPSTGCSTNILINIPGLNPWFHVVIYSCLVVFMLVMFTSPTRGRLSKAQEEDLCFSVSPKICHNDEDETKCFTKHQSVDKKGWCCAKHTTALPHTPINHR